MDTKPCHALMAELQALISPRVRAGRLRSSEMADATLTVTSLGDLGADAVLGVIYPPQLALVGFGRIRERPWAVGGALTVRPVVTASLAADHCATDLGPSARPVPRSPHASPARAGDLMTEAELRTAIAAELHKVAPDLRPR
ncbi:MAG: 2-oxo acid dehydrogenase subunit E2 [Vicinamibacterales bacterium]